MYNRISESWRFIKDEVRQSGVTEFVKSESDWVNYYELGKYIFVHSFIPTKLKDEYADMESFYGRYASYDMKEYDPSWRDASNDEWDAASWGCPHDEYDAGFFKPEEDKGKILVCGHWHAAAFHEKYEHEPSMQNHHTYIGKHLIALDACTVVSGFVNVLVLKEDEIDA